MGNRREEEQQFQKQKIDHFLKGRTCGEVNPKRREDRPRGEGPAPGKRRSNGAQNQDFKKSAPRRDIAPEAKPGGSPHGVTVAPTPTGSQKDQGCLSAAELAGIRAGKPATATKLRSELSARGYLVPVAGWVGSERSQRPRRQKDRALFSKCQQLTAFLQA